MARSLLVAGRLSDATLRQEWIDTTVSDGTTRFCANCGTANPAGMATCLSCRQPLSTGGMTSAFSDRPASAGSMGPGPLGGESGQGAASGGRNRERAWSDQGYQPPIDPKAPVSPGYGGRYDPPPYVIRQQEFDSPAAGLSIETPPPARSGCATGGCLMGLIAFGVICVLTMVLLGLVVGRPVLEDALGDELEEAVATQIVRELSAPRGSTPLAAGTYVIDADEINRELAADPDAYDPIENPTLTISPAGLEISFEAYGRESSYQGMVEVRRGRIVLTDVEADGLAEYILSSGEVRRIVERTLNDYFAENDLAIERVELGDGMLTVTAVPANGGTPSVIAESTATPNRAATATSPPRSTRAPTPRLLELPRTPTATDEDETAAR